LKTVKTRRCVDDVVRKSGGEASREEGLQFSVYTHRREGKKVVLNRLEERV